MTTIRWHSARLHNAVARHFPPEQGQDQPEPPSIGVDTLVDLRPETLKVGVGSWLVGPWGQYSHFSGLTW